MRAHRMHFRHGELGPGVFRAQGTGMSVNWEKYASAEETRKQSRREPEDNAVIRLLAGDIREIESLSLKHTPEPENRAHSEVFGLPTAGEEQTEKRLLLLRITEIVLPLSHLPPS